jgi:hypothetical protein
MEEKMTEVTGTQNLSQRMKEIRADLDARKCEQKSLEEEARAKKEREEQMTLAGVSRDLVYIVENWSPFFKQVEEEIYGSNPFPELAEFWSEVKHGSFNNFSLYNYDLPNIPIWKGYLRASHSDPVECEVRAFQKGFLFELGSFEGLIFKRPPFDRAEIQEFMRSSTQKDTRETLRDPKILCEKIAPVILYSVLDGDGSYYYTRSEDPCIVSLHNSHFTNALSRARFVYADNLKNILKGLENAIKKAYSDKKESSGYSSDVPRGYMGPIEPRRSWGLNPDA